MGIFISVYKTAECVVLAALFAAGFCATEYRALGALQSLGYSNKKLFLWYKKKNNALLLRESLLFMLCALSCAVLSLSFAFLGEWSAIVGSCGFLIFFILYVLAEKKLALRFKAAFTPRFKRLYLINFILTFALVYFCVTALNFAAYLSASVAFDILRYVPLSIFPLLTYPLVCLSNLISCIYEIPHNRGFVKRAKAKLQGAKNLTVIGVTGSYAKTSVKQILSQMLSTRFSVLSTPRSHNTPQGLAMTINNSALEKYDIFIAEMGARNIGDIAELCAFCPPDIAVITGICPQHLESFGSVENIIKAKGEILSAAKRAYISPDCYDLFEGYSLSGGKQNCNCVTDIAVSCGGVEFTLTLGGESVKCKSVLLGEHSAHNLGLAASVAFGLGMSLNEIAAAIENIDFVEHRLELKKSNGVNILDDGYNSNIKGAKEAINVLGSFEGRKIVVTPGLVELGVLEEKENFELGKRLAGLDFVILVGDTLVAPVREGYFASGGESDKLITVPNLIAAQEKLKGIINKGDAVLFLNDVPEIHL